MTIYFVLNARMPSKKAYGIHVAKMCEAFAGNGADVVLVVPRTHSSGESLRAFYGLSGDIAVTRIPAPDWYGAGAFGFAVSSFFFALFGFAYLATRPRKDAIIYTADTDSFSFALLPFAGLPVFMELHDWRGDTFVTRRFFRRVRGVIATNGETAQRLDDAFALKNRILIEPNGFDERWLERGTTKAAARARLNIPPDARVALYVGRFYAWKGLGIMAEAARLAPDIAWYAVGGTEAQFMRETGEKIMPPNLHIAGECAFDDVPVWLSAADVLLVIGTNANQQSARHTSPMKLFEYMALYRPVVAAETAALASFVLHDAVHWYAPDSAADLVGAVARAIALSDDAPILERAHREAQRHSWKARAARIKSFILALKNGRI